jgi:hypothetical protein
MVVGEEPSRRKARISGLDVAVLEIKMFFLERAEKEP